MIIKSFNKANKAGAVSSEAAPALYVIVLYFWEQF